MYNLPVMFRSNLTDLQRPLVQLMRIWFPPFREFKRESPQKNAGKENIKRTVYIVGVVSL